MKLITVFSILAVALMAQTVPQTPVGPQKPVAEVKTPSGPQLQTGKLWRLVAKAQALRQAANETPQAKEAAAAEAEVQKEQQALALKCGTEFVLALDQDSKSPTFEDVVCRPRPKETTSNAAQPGPKQEAQQSKAGPPPAQK